MLQTRFLSKKFKSRSCLLRVSHAQSSKRQFRAGHLQEVRLKHSGTPKVHLRQVRHLFVPHLRSLKWVPRSSPFTRPVPDGNSVQDGLPLSTREGAKMFSASDIEAQLLGQSREIPQGRPVFPVHGGYPVSLPPPTAGVPPGIMSLDQVEAAMRQQAHQRQLEANRQAQIAMELAQRAKAAQQQQDFARDMMQRSMEDLALQQRQTMPSNHTDVGSGGHPDRLHSLPHGSGPLRPPGHVAGVRPVMSPGEVQIMARPPQKMSFGFGGGSGSRQGFDNRPDRHLQPMPGMRPAMSYGFRDQRGDYGHRSPQHFGSEEERRLAERKRHNVSLRVTDRLECLLPFGISLRNVTIISWRRVTAN